MNDTDTPPWYDESKLRRARYAEGYSGWIIDLGDGTGRYANDPLLGADPGEQSNGTFLTEEQAAVINAAAPRWGDRVNLDGEGNPISNQIIERYTPA